METFSAPAVRNKPKFALILLEPSNPSECFILAFTFVLAFNCSLQSGTYGAIRTSNSI